MAEIRSCNRDPIAPKAYSIYYLDLLRKSLPTSVLNNRQKGDPPGMGPRPSLHLSPTDPYDRTLQEEKGFYPQVCWVPQKQPCPEESTSLFKTPGLPLWGCSQALRHALYPQHSKPLRSGLHILIARCLSRSRVLPSSWWTTGKTETY